ncbi:MAG TPA: hypothetical protein VFJ00_00345, partial [Candidatus Limnocylindria bacterium]|nr:hypothetical protein [Candidatus Limnocylindria bacterium]
MPDLLRRVATLTIVSAVAIGLLAPLTTRSATPSTAESMRLLAVAEAPFSLADRTAGDGRSLSAALSLSTVIQPIEMEDLGLNQALATPPTAPMEATLYRKVVKKAPVSAPVTGNTATG